jgi:beta-galactosidase
VRLADVRLADVRPADVRNGNAHMGPPEKIGMGELEPNHCVLNIRLHDRNGVLVQEQEARCPASYQTERLTRTVHFRIKDVERWSHENPALYYCTVSITDSDRNREIDAVGLAFGFRTIKVEKGALLINGEKVLLQGVNRHEFSETGGRSLTTKEMMTDIALLKRHHFNAVRCSHYPNDERWYELCDRYGLYLIDEANIEAHAYYDSLCRDPAWAGAFLARAQRMVLRDKNHPSVILWSLGNESGYGPNHELIAAWIRAFDSDRPLHYEGAVRPEWGQGPYSLESLARGASVTDIVCPMYPSIELIEQWDARGSDGRPLIMCEYSHAMGNSNGSLADYWEAIRKSKCLQGGFIWEWADHGILDKRSDGARSDGAGAGGARPELPPGPNASFVKPWRYGGDFGDSPSDLDFVCDGLLFPDRSLKPAMAECAYLFQPLEIAIQQDAGLAEMSGTREIDSSAQAAFVAHTASAADATFTSGSDSAANSGSAAGSAFAANSTFAAHADTQKALTSAPPLPDAIPILIRSRRYFEPIGPLVLKWKLQSANPDAPNPIAEGSMDIGYINAKSEKKLVIQPAGLKTESLGPAHSCECSLTIIIEGSDPLFAFSPLTYGKEAFVFSCRGRAESQQERHSLRADFSEQGFLCGLQISPNSGPAQPLLNPGGAQSLMLSPLEPVLFRAPTQNDGLKNFIPLRGKPEFAFYYENKAMYPWLDAGLDELRAELIHSDRVGTILTWHHRILTSKGIECGQLWQEWNIENPAALVLRARYLLNDIVPEYPRIGLKTRLVPGLSRIEWFGRGPHENYPDRQSGALMGRYQARPEELIVPYIVPQENGARGGVRFLALEWAALSASAKPSKNASHARPYNPETGVPAASVQLVIEGKTPFSFTISPYAEQELWQARHFDELAPLDEAFARGAWLYLDIGQRGLGTATCGPDTLERYRLFPGEYSIEFRFSYRYSGPSAEQAR